MSIMTNIRNWRQYRTTVAELNRLSTRELADLGIGRHEISAVARRAI